MDRAHRLPSARDFSRVLSAGARAARGPVVCAAARRSEDGPVRVGITVTRRTGNAVVRNRTKRRLREAMRSQVLADLQGLDVVLIARGNVAERNWKELVDDVRRAVSEASQAC